MDQEEKSREEPSGTAEVNSRTNGVESNGKRPADLPSARVKRKASRPPRMWSQAPRPPTPPPTPPPKINPPEEEPPKEQGGRSYQAQAVLLLLLRLRGCDCDQQVSVLRDEGGAVTLALDYSSRGGMETAKIRVHIVSAGRDDVDTRCLLSSLNFCCEDDALQVEFTSFDVSTLAGILEPCPSRTPFNLRLFRFLPQPPILSQLAEMLVKGGRLTLAQVTDFLARVRLASGQPDHTEIAAALRAEIARDLQGRQHVEAMYLKLATWARRWVDESKPDEFLSRSDLDDVFRGFKAELPGLHFELFQAVPTFFAREAELGWLGRTLGARGAELIDAVVAGEAGVGKTELVRRYLQKHPYDRVVVLPAHSAEALVAGLQRAARLYSLREGADVAQLLAALYAALKGRRSLLVFEGVDSLPSIQSLLRWALPPARPGAPSIVVTSRQSSWIIRHVLLLPSFSESEACAFLARSLPCEPSLLSQLAAKLACLPLSLQVAAASISQGPEGEENQVAENLIAKNQVAQNLIAENQVAKNQVVENLGAENQVVEYNVMENQVAAYVSGAAEGWSQVQKVVSRSEHGALALTLLEVAALMGGEHLDVATFLLLPELYCDDAGIERLSGAIALLQSLCLLRVSRGVACLQRLTSEQVLTFLREDPTIEESAIDRALTMAHNDTIQNKESRDANVHIFSPGFVPTWLQVFRHALRHRHLVTKHCRLVPMLMYDVFHRGGCSERLEAFTGLFKQLVAVLEDQVRPDDLEGSVLKSLRLAKLELARRACMSHMSSQVEGALKGVVDKHLDKYGDDAFMLFSMI